METNTTVPTVTAGVRTLCEIETFLANLNHLRALCGDLHQRRSKVSRGERWLLIEIGNYTERCRNLAAQHPDIGRLWEEAQAQLRGLQTPPA